MMVGLIPFLFSDYINCLQSWTDVNTDPQAVESRTNILIKESIIFFTLFHTDGADF